MAKILFKKGSYDEFKLKVLDTGTSVDGALYLTEDEGGLYLGTGAMPKRISGSVLFFASLEAFEDGVKPPYSTDVIYFLADRDALVRWNGSKWIILNQTADSVNAAITEINNAIANINTTLNTVKNTADGALQKSGGTMSGNINMGGNAITNLKTPATGTDAATKQYVDDKASALLGATGAASSTETIRGALTGVSEAKAEADNALKAAQQADSKAANAMSRANQMLPLDGTGTMQGNIDAGNFNVINVATPSADHHAVNRKYVTDQVATLNTAISAAQTKANKAEGDAAAAQTAADLAQQTANTAKANAATAQTAAENANANADTRVLKSDFESFKTTNTSRIDEVEEHPDSDHLHVCKVSDGKDVLQVVCGAPNVKKGMIGVLAHVGAYIPLFNEKIKVGKVRGVESFGMMCAEDELLIGEDHTGIIDLKTDEEIKRDYDEMRALLTG